MVASIDPKRFEQLKATGNLPSPKGVALAIMRLTQREDVTLMELANVIRTDPALVGRLVKAANGVRQPGRRPVVSVQDCLLVLGLPAVRTMALGFSLLNGYRGGGCTQFDYDGYWSGAVIMAITMQHLAQRARLGAADELFSLGLLARVGLLALATIYPDVFGELLTRAGLARRSLMRELESQAFSVQHDELSAAMLAEWGMPRPFCSAVAAYDNGEAVLEGARERALAAALLFAESLAASVLAASEEFERRKPALYALGVSLGLSEEDVDTCVDEVRPQWLSWSAALDLGGAPSAKGVVSVWADAPEPDPLGETPAPPVDPVHEAVQARVRVPAAADGNRLRVLVVDDQGSLRRLIRAVLEEQGHEVFEAEDGQQGLEMALDLMPDMMVVDWVMPRLDGLGLIRALRAARQGRSIYILLMTMLEDEARLVEAFEAGTDDFMVKPFSPRLLSARLLAGKRVVRLQRELEQDREELRRFAAQLAVTNRRLREAALTDPLTGFPNRRYAMERLQQEWSASARSLRALSCMLVDVDNFKLINDSEGHDVGDRVLREAAACFKQALRREDVICRTGGDEFLVICPDCSLDAARICAERLRRAAHALTLPGEGRTLCVTVSVGVATRDASMSDIDALIKCADRGAYLAKGKGRNAVVALQVTGEPPGKG